MLPASVFPILDAIQAVPRHELLTSEHRGGTLEAFGRGLLIRIVVGSESTSCMGTLPRIFPLGAGTRRTCIYI